MHRFQVTSAPQYADLAYVAHEITLGKRLVWVWSFQGRDGALYSTSVAESESDASQKAKQSAESHGTWPQGQKAVVMWNLGGRY